MPSRGRHRRGDEEDFQLAIEVPKDIRHDPVLLREWLNNLSEDLLNAEEIRFDPDPDEVDLGTTESVKVMLSVRPCGGRFPEHVDGPVDPEDFDRAGPSGDISG